jgi:pimeloyl-ACP methyl ester carboxylesterase
MRVTKQHLQAARPTGSRLPVLLGIGAALAAAAWVVRSKTQQVEKEHPPLGKFIEVEGVRLHYIERGQGQPLVLLHGMGDMAESFALGGLLDLAATKYRVIAFDRPGYGYSERPRTRAWTPAQQADLLHHALQTLGIERPILAAHSLGTQVALQMALKYPASVHSLVLMSGYYFPTLRLDSAPMSIPAIPIVGDVLRYTLSPLIGRLTWPLMKRWLFRPAGIPARFEAFPVWMTLRPSQLRASAAEAAMAGPTAQAMKMRYRELTMPVILLSGDGDRYVFVHNHTRPLCNRLPQAELHLAAGAGHMVHYLVPQQIMEAIDSAAQTEQLVAHAPESHPAAVDAMPSAVSPGAGAAAAAQ